jgi:hypothetical protein
VRARLFRLGSRFKQFGWRARLRRVSHEGSGAPRWP